MRFSKYFLFLFLLVFSFDLKAQLADAVYPLEGKRYPGEFSNKINAEKMRYSNDGPLPFRVLGQDEGLPVNNVYSLFQDTHGLIWVGGAGGGLASFDGLFFYDYGHLPCFKDKNIMDILEDHNGNIWFATYGHGLVRYDGIQFEEFSDITGLPGKRLKIIDLFEDSNGILWAATQKNEVFKIEGDSLSHIHQGLYGDTFAAIGESPNGEIWFGSWTGNISIWDGASWRCKVAKDGLPTSTIRSILPFEDKMFIGTHNEIYFIKGDKVEKVSDAACAHSCFSAMYDQSGSIWISTKEGKLMHLDDHGVSCLGPRDGVPRGNTYDLLVDSENKIWFGSSGNGLIRNEGGLFTHYTYEIDEINMDTRCISQGPGERLFAFSNGDVARLNDEGNWDVVFQTEELIISMNWLNEDSLVVGKYYGASLWDGSELSTLLPRKKFTEYVNHSIQLKANPGKTAIGTSRGLYIISATDTLKFTTSEGLNSNGVQHCVEDDQGWIWLATNSGLSVLSPDLQEVNSFESSYFSAGDILSDLMIIGEKLWIGNYAIGLYQADLNTLRSVISENHYDSNSLFAHYGKSHGLPQQNTVCLTKLDEGRVLVGNKKQISIFNIEEEKVEHVLGADAGLIPTELFAKGSSSASNDEFWWRGKQQFVQLKWDNQYERINPPQIQLQEVSLFSEPLNLDSIQSVNPEFSYSKAIGKNYIQFEAIRMSDGMPTDLVLSQDQNNLTFRFFGSDWTAPRSVQFQYYLEGFEDDWLDPSVDRKVTYQNLSPGDYRLHYRCIGADGITGESEEFWFTIHIPFYQTYWFRGIMVALGLLLIYLFLKWRTYRLRKENEMLELKVEERTEEVKQEQQKSERLLLNILPVQTAEELKERGSARTRKYDSTSVIFSDFRGFTQMTETMDSEELVSILDKYFQQWDDALEEFEIEKIKTIGDAYMCASGIPESVEDHAIKAADFALKMLNVAAEINAAREHKGLEPWEARIGIHSGPVIAGVVGKKKFAYDIWGDTVNTASRMESNGAPGKVNISKATYDLIKSEFNCEHRGLINAKGKGEMDMYFILNRK